MERGSVGGMGAQGAVPGASSPPRIMGYRQQKTVGKSMGVDQGRQREPVAGESRAEQEKKEPRIGGEKGDGLWSDDRRKTAKGKHGAKDAGGGGWMEIGLGRHGGDNSKSLAWGTPQGLRCSQDKGTEHIPGAHLGSPWLHVVLPTMTGQDGGVGALGGAGAEALSPLRGAGVGMRKAGPQLPLQGTSDFPGLSQWGWWWCQGVGISPDHTPGSA